jgi:hypothetical protein
VLRQKLSTYTSCFRVYRRSALQQITLREEGYLGVAEMVAELDQRGSAIVEYPATLEVRVLGLSKMKTLRTIWGHVRLLSRLALRPLGRLLGFHYPAPVQADSALQETVAKPEPAPYSKASV